MESKSFRWSPRLHLKLLFSVSGGYLTFNTSIKKKNFRRIETMYKLEYLSIASTKFKELLNTTWFELETLLKIVMY